MRQCCCAICEANRMLSLFTGKSNSQTSGDEGIVMSNSNSQTFLATTDSNHVKVESQTPNVKKRHRRMKSSGVKNNEYDGKRNVVVVSRVSQFFAYIKSHRHTQIPMRWSFTLFRWTTNSGISRRPVRRKETIGWLWSRKKSSNRFRATNPVKRSHNHPVN